MNRQMDAGFYARFGAKISNIWSTRCASSLIRLCARPGSIPIALIALFLITTSASTMFSPVRTVSATTETIVTVDATYTIPKASWNLGETAHARVDGEPLPSGSVPYVRRVIWVAPDGSVAQIHALSAVTHSDDYSIPSAGAFAQVGTWTVKTIDNRGVGHASANFTVLSTTAANADLSITKSGPALANAGDSVTYTLTITNNGPDAAQNVEISDPVPDNTTFVSETQTAGPTATCGNQVIDGITTSVCTISSLDANAVASFTLVYTIGSGVGNGTVIFNGATVTSSTSEINSQDNQASFNTLVSSTPPPPPCTINCPSDKTADNDANQCSAVVIYATPTTSGNCADENGNVPPVVCSPPSGSTFPIGSTSVTCASGGNTCTFTVTVHDTRPPVQPTITCPGNVTTNEDSAGSGGATVNYAAPTTNGNCVNVVCFPPSGSRFSVGTTTVNCTATDSSNQTAPCSFNVTVNASTCFINCPDDTTVNESSPGSGSATVTYSTPAITGTCPSLTITCIPTSGSSFPVGITQVNCTARDQSSVVVATCGFTVTVNGSSSCSIVCPPNITVAANGTCPPSNNPCATVNYATPTTSGICAALPVCTPPSGSSFGIGTTIVHCSATDPGGNAASCNFTVVVTGGTPCTITCPSVAPQPSDAGGCTTVVTYPNPTTTGSCGDPGNPNPWSCNPPSGSVFPVGTTTVNCSTDVGTACSFPVTVTGTDAVPPVITTCATPTFVLADSNCQGVVPNVTSDVDATDNCTPTNLLTITQNPVAGTLVGTGTTTITLTVKDANNNSTTCTTGFFVFEPTLPTALCKPYTAVLDATGHATVIAANVDNGSSDNCAIASRTVTPSTFTCANKGPNTVTLTVTDPSGNSASCQTTVTVVDITPPAISCPLNITKNNDPGLCSAVVTYPNATAIDNCSGVGTPVCTPASNSTFQKGTTTVTCTVSDASGNLASCAFTVTVNDTQPPTIACLSDIISDFDPAVNGATVTYATPVGTDNCPGATTAQIAGLPSGSTFPAGTTTNTFRVTDAVGNTAECSFKVTVALTSIVGLDSVSITGSGLVNSYNSAGGYPATQGSLVNVLSNGTITLGNSGKVMGNVRSTRAGVAMSGASQVTGNATAGTTVSRSGSATVGGTITNNQLAPVMTLPAVAACSPYSSNSGISGTFSYNQSTGDLTLSGVNIATLANGTYCFHNITLTNSAQLKVNGLVVIKLTGTLNASGATSFSNTTGIPGNLRILSSYTGTTGVTLGNSTNVQLVIYAPGTGVSISGAAPLFGTVVGKTVTIGNSGMLHYDTQLKSIWPEIWSLLP